MVRNATRNDRSRDELEIDVPLVYAKKVPAMVQKLWISQETLGKVKGGKEDQHLFLYAVGLSCDYDAESAGVLG